jgi:hypothetical protein
MAVRWLQCTVRPGMFDSEFMVGIEVPGRGELTAIFVDKKLVRVSEEPERGHPVIGHVRVYAREEGDQAVCMLPVQSVEHAYWIGVPAALLADAGKFSEAVAS